MANIKFTQLPNLTTPTADTIVPVVKSNVNYTVTTDTLTAYVNNNSGNITATGNITAAFFSGNGSALTSINGSNVAGAVANATYAVLAGTATTADSANAVAGANVSGTVANATYAITAGSATTAATANSVAGANVTGTVANATYATSSGTAQYVTANAQANITSVGILTSLSASGNITGNYFIGNGSALTGLGATYSNANATSLMANFGSNTISTSGNITGGYVLGNGSQLTGLPDTYSNANVVTLLSAFGSNSISTTGNVTSSYVVSNGSLLTNLTGANVSGTVGNATYATSAGTAATANTAATAVTVTQASQPAITSVGTLTGLSVSGNVQGGNLNTTGSISATGNITGNYFVGNGSALTGVTSSLPSTISVTGNITSGSTIRGNTYSELTNSITFSSSITPAFSNGSVQKFTASSNFSLNAPTGIPSGGSITLIITQDATGNRIMTPNAAYKFAYGVKTLSTAASAIDVMSVFYDGTNYLCNLVKSYS